MVLRMKCWPFTLALFTFFFFESNAFCSQLNFSKCSSRTIPEILRLRNSLLFIFESGILLILAKIWCKILWSRCWHTILPSRILLLAPNSSTIRLTSLCDDKNCLKNFLISIRYIPRIVLVLRIVHWAIHSCVLYLLYLWVKCLSIA